MDISEIIRVKTPFASPRLLSDRHTDYRSISWPLHRLSSQDIDRLAEDEPATAVGYYLARHGYASGQKVLELIQELRKDTKDHHRPSPESNQQIDMVLSWVEEE